MRYPSPWDRTLRLSTGLAVGILGIVAAAILLLGWRIGGPAVMPVVAVVVGILAAIVLLARAYAPTGFAISAGQVRIERRLRPIAIPLAAIRSAGPLPDGAVANALRLGGVGGLFGFYGRHWSRRLGEFGLYATRMRGLVQLDTAEGRWVLSPEPAGRFLEELLAHAPGAARVAAEGPHPRHPLRRATWLRLAAMIATVPVAAGAIVLASVAWSPVGARVEARAVVVERRWVAPVAIPLSEVREVEVLGPGRVGRVRKVAGYQGLGHAAWGSFRSPELGAFQLYAWRRGPWVLLETAGGRIVLTPEDPQAFAEAVRAAVAR